MNKEQLADLANELKTQDNLYTADPIFIILETKKIFGMDPEYTDDFEWFDEDDPDFYFESADGRSDDEMIEAGFIKTYYIEHDDFVCAHFTRKAADHYRENNSHRHRNPLKIYVDSMYRCREMIEIREHLMKGECEPDYYCMFCEKPIKEKEEGYVRNNLGFCSEECADEYDARG